MTNSLKRTNILLSVNWVKMDIRPDKQKAMYAVQVSLFHGTHVSSIHASSGGLTDGRPQCNSYVPACLCRQQQKQQTIKPINQLSHVFSFLLSAKTHFCRGELFLPFKQFHILSNKLIASFRQLRKIRMNTNSTIHDRNNTAF